MALSVLALVCAREAMAAGPMLGTSTRAAREDAMRSIPLDKLAPALKAKVTATLADTTIYRRLPVQVIDCDPDLYLFLVRHPEVVVNIWEVMKISNVAIQRTGPDTFRASDGVGTLCDVTFCYSDHETQVVYAEGSYNGPLLSRPVRAKCVLLLKSGYMQETNGRYYVTTRMDTFIHIDHAGLEILAKTLQPLMNRTADYNFAETAGFFSTISRTAESNPAGMARLAVKLANVDDDVRDRFSELAVGVGRKSRERKATQASVNGPLTKAGQVRALSDRR